MSTDPELKKALDALSITFDGESWRGSAIWHWAWNYKGEPPPPLVPIWPYDAPPEDEETP